MLEGDRHYVKAGYEECNEELRASVVEECAKFAEDVLSPLNKVPLPRYLLRVRRRVDVPVAELENRDGFARMLTCMRVDTNKHKQTQTNKQTNTQTNKQTTLTDFNYTHLLACSLDLKVGDEEGAKHDPKTKDVKTPTGWKEAYESYAALGWQGLSVPEAYGGQGLPTSLNMVKGRAVCHRKLDLGHVPWPEHRLHEHPHPLRLRGAEAEVLA